GDGLRRGAEADSRRRLHRFVGDPETLRQGAEVARVEDLVDETADSLGVDVAEGREEVVLYGRPGLGVCREADLEAAFDDIVPDTTRRPGFAGRLRRPGGHDS